MLIHTGEIQHAFPECCKRLRHASAVKRHMLIHKRVLQKCVLRNHMLTHNIDMPYVSSECGKRLILACQLERHMLTHTGENMHVQNVIRGLHELVVSIKQINSPGSRITFSARTNQICIYIPS